MEPNVKRCGDMLPDLLDGRPADRLCIAVEGHEGEHNDGFVLWESAQSAAIRGAVKGLEDRLVEDAPRAARVAVLSVADAQTPNPIARGPNREERRKHLRPVRDE